MSVSSIIGINSNSYNLIKKGIEASTLRGETIANNIANVNTKNYKKFTVVFEENLKGNNEGNVNLNKTNSKHISTTGDSGEIEVVKDTSNSMRTDGNNVDIEVEKTNQAANTLKYNALVQMASGKISTISYVITSK